MTTPEPLLSNQVCLLTGATGALGAALLDAFVSHGATLALLVRDEGRARANPAIAAALAAHPDQIKFFICDLDRPETILPAVDRVLAELGRIDILVNNAGIQGPIGPLDEVPWEEWLATLRADLISPAALCRAVLPEMKRRRRGKIINLSGGGATGPRPNFTAYATAKAALARLTETLAHEVKEFGIDVNSIAPGFMHSRMTEETLAAGAEKAGAKEYASIEKLSKTAADNPRRAAALAVHLASPATDGITGRLLSAVWDPWQDLPARAAELDPSDIYTIRRIVPEDRGKKW